MDRGRYSNVYHHRHRDNVRELQEVPAQPGQTAASRSPPWKLPGMVFPSRCAAESSEKKPVIQLPAIPAAKLHLPSVDGFSESSSPDPLNRRIAFAGFCGSRSLRQPTPVASDNPSTQTTASEIPSPSRITHRICITHTVPPPETRLPASETPPRV